MTEKCVSAHCAPKSYLNLTLPPTRSLHSFCEVN